MGLNNDFTMKYVVRFHPNCWDSIKHGGFNDWISLMKHHEFQVV